MWSECYFVRMYSSRGETLYIATKTGDGVSSFRLFCCDRQRNSHRLFRSCQLPSRTSSPPPGNGRGLQSGASASLECSPRSHTFLPNLQRKFQFMTTMHQETTLIRNCLQTTNDTRLSAHLENWSYQHQESSHTSTGTYPMSCPVGWV